MPNERTCGSFAAKKRFNDEEKYKLWYNQEAHAAHASYAAFLITGSFVGRGG